MPQQRFEFAKTYYKNLEFLRVMYRTLHDIYGRHNRPSEQALQNKVYVPRPKATSS